MSASSLYIFKQCLIEEYFEGDRDPEAGITLMDSFLDDGNYNLVKSMVEREVPLTEEIIQKFIRSFDLINF